MASFFKGKVVLVTGATGSIGTEIVRQLLVEQPARIRLFSRDEHKQFLLQQEFADQKHLRFLLGDVRDLSRLTMALENVDVVFHCAAYKHVPFCEFNSFEAVKTNVIGTQNVIDAALHQNVERVILISTDKAASPLNVMGATKLLAERLMTSAMRSRGDHRTRFASIRFGNVLASRGSAIPTFISQIAKGGPVTITDPSMTRFFISIPEAVRRVLHLSAIMEGGELFVLKMPMMKLQDLVDVLIEEVAPRHGLDPQSITTTVTGPRPGEKTDEILLTDQEALMATETEQAFIVPPILSDLPSKEARVIRVKGYATGGVTPLTKPEIRELLRSASLL